MADGAAVEGAVALDESRGISHIEQTGAIDGSAMAWVACDEKFRYSPFSELSRSELPLQ